jgi:hypothetical protein
VASVLLGCYLDHVLRGELLLQGRNRSIDRVEARLCRNNPDAVSFKLQYYPVSWLDA